MDSYDHSFDAIVAIGMHAGAGNSAGFQAHTKAGEDVEYRVNGVPFNESMILAAGHAYDYWPCPLSIHRRTDHPIGHNNPHRRTDCDKV